MLDKLRTYIDSNDLIEQGERIIAAVSGGIDSVVMLDLLSRAGFNCEIAHCNFQLRGDESEAEMKFVASLGEKYGFKTHIKRFDTSGYSSEMGISTQMAARDLRYEWFSELSDQLGIGNVAIAHNSDDNIETFFLNLSRGTGLAGLTGMAPRSGIFIRPLLWAGRNDIEGYCREKGLVFMEDSSNAKTNYKRNYIRHRLIPLFENLNPNFREIMSRNIEQINQAGKMLDRYFAELKGRIVSEQGSEKKINLDKLRNIPEPGWFLHKLLTGDGFTPSQVNDILESVDSEPGKMFYSNNHKLLKDRDFLFVVKSEKNDPAEISIDNWSGSIDYPIELTWEIADPGNFRIDPDPSAACLDASLLKLPLKLRKWEPADFFYPLGMKKKKKLSDFFIDNKLSLIDKENTWLLVSGTDIVWIIGHRIDNRYRVNEKTKRILCLRISE